MSADENPPTGVRFDPVVKAQIQEIARVERRTFGAQVNVICEEWLAQRAEVAGLRADPPGNVARPTNAPAHPQRPGRRVSGGH